MKPKTLTISYIAEDHIGDEEVEEDIFRAMLDIGYALSKITEYRETFRREMLFLRQD